MAAISNLYMDQGSTFDTCVYVRDSSGCEVDVTGYTIRSQMRKSYGSSVAYTFQVQEVNPRLGVINLHMTAEETRDIPAGRYLYDVEATNPDGTRWRIVEGLVVVTHEITKI